MEKLIEWFLNQWVTVNDKIGDCLNKQIDCTPDYINHLTIFRDKIEGLLTGLLETYVETSKSPFHVTITSSGDSSEQG